jgi:ABC-type multidrug transport system fused ATPase/permease subunit
MLVGLSQILSGMREVKLSGNRDYFLSYFDRLHQTLNRNALNARLMGNVPGGVLGLLGQIAFIASALILWNSGLAGIDILAHLAVIAVVVARILPAVNKIIASVSTLTRSLPYVEGLLTLIHEAKAGNATISQVEFGVSPMPEKWRSIEVKNITYSYGSGGKILKNFSFKFERGKRYGIVGRSGSGKSTLISIILGLFPPDEGAVYVDGIPREQINTAEWTRALAYVPQDVLILDDSLLENVLFGSGIPSEKAWFDESIRRACLDKIFEESQRNIEAKLGERGRQISGGQSQRIAIARALYRKPSILILDEATSALDSETERVIQENILEINASGLTIAVAHRLGALKNYDQILVLDKGMIEHSGTYEELLVTSEVFRRLATENEDNLTQDTTK